MTVLLRFVNAVATRKHDISFGKQCFFILFQCRGCNLNAANSSMQSYTTNSV
jgi:hypothetical protein